MEQSITTMIAMWVFGMLMASKAKEARNLRLEKEIRRKEMLRYRLRLQDIARKKIEETSSLKTKGEDALAKYCYHQNRIKELGDDFAFIYSSEYRALRETSPGLTDLDLLILTLLALEMENSEICSLLKMERRTLYRRRQLIAQRTGLSSSDLEVFAQNSILGEDAPKSRD